MYIICLAAQLSCISFLLLLYFCLCKHRKRNNHSVSSVLVVSLYICSVAVVKHKYLPYLDCLFLTESSLVCVGYDCYPTLWNHNDNNQLTFMNRLDQKEKKAAGGHLS